MNIKKNLVIGGLVAVGGLVTYSVIKKKNNTEGFIVKDFIIGDLDEVKEVLETLNSTAESYDNVFVSDYYEAIGEPTLYKDNVYGWTAKTIKKTKVVKVNGGWKIKFPPVKKFV